MRWEDTVVGNEYVGRLAAQPGSHPSDQARAGLDASRVDPCRDQWLIIEADAALQIDCGREKVLCDRLPRPVALLLKNPTCRAVCDAIFVGCTVSEE